MFDLSVPEPVRADMYSLQGRVLRNVFSASLCNGNHTMYWDGRDQLGRRVRQGTYIVRIESGRQRFMREVLRIRIGKDADPAN